jgi:hypothetical protein
MDSENVQWTYEPNNLLDCVIACMGFTSDAALCNALGVWPSVISKIRHYQIPIGASLLIRMHDMTNLTIKDLRLLMDDRREKFRPYTQTQLDRAMLSARVRPPTVRLSRHTA